MWSTLAKRTSWGVLASWLADRAEYSGVEPGYRLLSVLTWLVAPPEAAELLGLTLASTAPLTRYLTSSRGPRTMSSWSVPIMFAPLRLSTPITAEGDVLDADFLAERRFVLEEFAAQGLADHADLAAVAHVVDR